LIDSQPQVTKLISCLLAHSQWFSPGTPASSTTKTGRHDIAEILLKVALKHQRQALMHAKLVLFIDNNQSEFVKGNALLK
jgi:hypothetical protein